MAIGTLATLPQKFGTALSLYGGVGGGVTERYAPNFNGVSQYGDLPKINLSTGDTVRIRFISSNNQPGVLKILTDADLDTEDRFVIFHDASIIFRLTNCAATLDGQNIISSVTPFPYDGLPHEIVATATADCIFGTLCARASTMVSNLEVTPLSVTVNDGSVYNFPMDDGWANNPVMRNAAKPLGDDVKSDPSSLGQGWSEISPNNYQIDGTNTSPSIVSFAGILELNSRYIIEFRIYDYVSGSMRFNSPASNSDFFSENGSYKTLFDSGSSSSINIQAFTANSEFKVEIMSIRLAEGYGEFINMTEAAWVKING